MTRFNFMYKKHVAVVEEETITLGRNSHSVSFLTWEFQSAQKYCIFSDVCWFQWLPKRRLGTSITPHSFLSCYLTCWRSFPQHVLILLAYLSRPWLIFFPLNCPWDHPAVFSQCSSHLLLELTHDVTASCWVRSHFGLHPRMFWETVSVGSELDSVSRIDFESSNRTEHVCGCALWICACPDKENKLSKEHQHVLIVLWQLYWCVTLLQHFKSFSRQIAQTKS